MEADFTKRVYQGVRVKHTVKDLLAEKRSQQISGQSYSEVPASSPFIQMTGSHKVPGYYSIRRPFLSEAEFCSSSKQFSTDIYSSSLIGKSLSCDSAAISSYSSLIDSYYSESLSDLRSSAHAAGGGNIFSSAALSTILPPFNGDTSSFLLREPWEQAGMEAMEGLGGNSLAPTPMEPSSPSQNRSASRGPGMASSQFYSLHTIDDVPYHSSFQRLPAFPCPAYREPTAKLPNVSIEDSEIVHSSLNDPMSWVKEDTTGIWPNCEIRRAF